MNTQIRNHRKFGNDRFKAFKGNRSEGQGFADRRKEKAKHEYNKLLTKERKHQEYLQNRVNKSGKFSQERNTDKDSKPTVPTNKIYKNSKDISTDHTFKTSKKKFKKKETPASDDDTSLQNARSKKPVTKFTKVQQQFEEKAAVRDQRKKEKLKTKKEKQTAMLNYINQKQDRHKKLCKKTYKGQPVMKNQLEFLLQKIQNSSS